jgi:magnesium-protoporphyrin O-methyltransferase
MASCCSTYGDVAARQFDARKVAEELALYQKDGPGETTRLLRDGLVQGGLARGLLLDVGAGFGPLTFELLDRGIFRAVVVDASRPFLNAAAAEAARRRRSTSVELVHGDFVDVAATLPLASVVTMDRVVCCYPDIEPLLDAAFAHAERALALSYPRGSWFARAAMGLDNLKRRMTGNTFRTVVHSPRDMEQRIRAAGFRLVFRRTTWIWAADIYAR